MAYRPESPCLDPCIADLFSQPLPALPEGTVASLLEEANRDQLIAILTYHFVPGKVMAADLAGQTIEADTVNGKTLNVDGTDGVTVNGAMVTSADIEAGNGVIHVIDTVLIP